MPVLHHSKNKEIFPHVIEANCTHLSCPWTSLKKKPFSVFFALILWIYVDMGRFPQSLLFSIVNSPSDIFHRRKVQSLHHVGSPFMELRVCLFFSYTGMTRIGYSSADVALPVLSREKNYLSQLAGSAHV